MEFRAERAGDEPAIRAVHLAAFPTSLEANLVERLRSDGDAVISFLASDGDQVIGHVLLSRMDVEAEGEKLLALGLAPVAVSPDWQGRGIASALIEAALAEARSASAAIVFVLGEPAFYRRFGFDAEAAAPFSSPYSSPYFQALVISDDLPPPQSGRADYAAPFAALE